MLCVQTAGTIEIRLVWILITKFHAFLSRSCTRADRCAALACLLRVCGDFESREVAREEGRGGGGFFLLKRNNSLTSVPA